MISAVARFLQSLLIGFLALFKRALCFLSRKRRNSGAILPTHVKTAEVNMPTQVLSDSFQFPAPSDNHVMQEQVNAGIEEVPEEEAYTEWDTWDKPTSSLTSSDSRHQHFPSNSSKQPVPEPEPEPDYFSDLGLAPTIKKQKKVLVKSAIASSQHSTERSSRLAFAPEQAVPISAELEEWDDEAAGAWEDDEDLTLEAEQAMRQTRKAERERRLAEHQRRNQEKEQMKNSKDNSRLATKLS